MSQLIPNFKRDKTSLSLISNDISGTSLIEINNTNTNNNNNLSQNPSNNNNSNQQQSYNYIINPDLITYITRIQNEQDKYRRLPTLGEISEKGHSANLYQGLNENIHFDTNKKSKARRSLLYLLNEMSGGAFCPEIKAYFNELKEMKKIERTNAMIEQSKKEQQQVAPLQSSTLKDNLSIKNPLTRMKTLKNQLLGKDNLKVPQNNSSSSHTLNNPQNNKNQQGFSYNFKRRDKENVEDHKLTKGFELKQYAQDYKMKDLENVYSLEEIETGASKFQYSKAAIAKYSLKKEKNKDLNHSKKKKKKRRKNLHNNSNNNDSNNTSSGIGKGTFLMRKDNSNTEKTPRNKLKGITAIEEADNSSSSR